MRFIEKAVCTNASWERTKPALAGLCGAACRTVARSRFVRQSQKLLYSSYETMLINEIKEKPVPSHVAIIMDGNRRYAQKYGLARYYGHFRGADTTEKVLDWSFDLGIKQLTIYAFSTENFSRSEEEKNQIFDLIKSKLDKLCNDERTHKRRMRVRIIGKVDVLPESLQNTIRRVEETTKNYNGVYLNIAIAYGGRQEILDLTKIMAHKIKSRKLNLGDINEYTITKSLYSSIGSIPYVDFIIRTGGNERLSNFLPWQTNGNECAAYFCAPFWPEFRKVDFLRSIIVYQTREQERHRSTVMRIVNVLRFYGKVKAKDVIRISNKFVPIPKREIIKILNELNLVID